MRVLVVEDHPKLADYLRKGLTENGYVVDVAADGIDGRHLAVNGEYDIVVLDVMLPGLDGFAVLKAIRAAKDVAVLMLTARDQVEDRVRGLEAGADDYLVKPFAFDELLARLTALRRRGVRSGGTSEPTTLTLGDLQLDLARRKASRGAVAGARGQHVGGAVEALHLQSSLEQRDQQAAGSDPGLEDRTVGPREPLQIERHVGQRARRFVEVVDLCANRPVAIGMGGVGRNRNGFCDRHVVVFRDGRISRVAMGKSVESGSARAARTNALSDWRWRCRSARCRGRARLSRGTVLRRRSRRQTASAGDDLVLPR